MKNIKEVRETMELAAQIRRKAAEIRRFLETGRLIRHEVEGESIEERADQFIDILRGGKRS